MFQFIQRHAKNILGTLSGFDRLRFRGTLRQIAYAAGMQAFLNHSGVLLKDFKEFMCGTSKRAQRLLDRQLRTDWSWHARRNCRCRASSSPADFP